MGSGDDLAGRGRRRLHPAPPRRPDLSGVVAAPGTQAAGRELDEVPGWCLNAGGDVLTRGQPADGHDWVVGIVGPDDRQSW
ncbi:MAG: hypothetical protein Q4G45_10215 [Actinomycetia bacterium]|nr:hypothetical protein [Actinomycetes bacterium]